MIPPLLGYYSGLGALPITRFHAPMNFDAVFIDWEHTSCNVETMTSMVHEAVFMSHWRTIPWVRVPGHDHAAIGFALDAGASIVLPQVETVEQARYVVSSAKCGTKQNGTRSAPPFRLIPSLTDTPYDPTEDIHKRINNQATIMIQIESLEGSSEPEWPEARDKFFVVMDKHDKPYSGFCLLNPLHGSPEAVERAAERMSMIFTSVDAVALSGMAHELVHAREVVAIPDLDGDKQEN